METNLTPCIECKFLIIGKEPNGEDIGVCIQDFAAEDEDLMTLDESEIFGPEVRIGAECNSFERDLPIYIQEWRAWLDEIS